MNRNNILKIINYFIIILITILSLYILFFGNMKKEIYIIVILLSIIPVMLLPYIINSFIKNKIDESVITLYLIFIFFAHFLGAIVNLYYKIESYDKVMHTFSGIMTSFLAVIILVKANLIHKNSLWMNILFVLSFSTLIAFSWEFYEFTCDKIFNKDAQRVALTGVNDTMTDMIVAFFGSCIFSCIYAFESKVLKKGILISFCKTISG